MAESKYDSNIAYTSVSPEINSGSEDASLRPKIELGAHPQLAQPRGFLSTLFIQVLSILWLVPIVALLYLNYTEYIIGASAWCPGGRCWVDAFNADPSVPSRNKRRFDKESHNLLGALQLVAKALEIWFMMIAAAVVYLITMRFAGKQEGFPIGYLTRPVEFADPVSLIDPLLWKTGPSPFGAKNAHQKKLGRRVWFLIVLSVSLCVLCNLIGPATAVLVIPALQWINTPDVGNRLFSGINSVPDSTSWFYQWSLGCTAEQYSKQKFSCTQYPFGNALDSWLDGYVGAYKIIQPQDGGQVVPIYASSMTPQDLLTFSANSTQDLSTNKNGVSQYHDVVWWAPSRQIVANISTDYQYTAYVAGNIDSASAKAIDQIYGFTPDPYETYFEYNKSLELEIHRNGPILGATITSWLDFNDQDSWNVNVDANRQVKCYDSYSLSRSLGNSDSSDTDVYIKCIQTGSGWGPTSKQQSFSVQGAYDSSSQTVGSTIDINVFSSPRAVFFPNDESGIPSWFPKGCLGFGTFLNGTKCDWNRLFSPDPQSPIANRTENINTIEFTMKQDGVSTKWVVDYSAYLGFTDYYLNPSPNTNPQLTVQTPNLPNAGKSVPIDPLWTLAAWSANPGGQLLPDRATPNYLLQAMQSLYSNVTSKDNQLAVVEYNYVAIVPVLHTLSLVDHSTKWVSDPSKYSKSDPDQPLLVRYGKMYVWCYGVTSRTAWLGAIVCILGAAVVVAHVILGFIDRRRYRSPTQLLVAALEHCPRGEFANMHHDETQMARVRFHIKDDDDHAGKFSFYEPATNDHHDPTTGQQIPQRY